MRHQYIERDSGEVRTETLLGDGWIRFFYGTARERTPILFNALTSARMSDILGFLNFDSFIGERLAKPAGLAGKMGIDITECLDPPESLDTRRKLFERKIRFWQCRPMPRDQNSILSPSDAKVLMGSFREVSNLFLKEKFFSLPELLGGPGKGWISAFEDGDFAVFRLTPEKYHYNHAPASGIVLAFYEIEGRYHSCNPDAVLAVATPHSMNRRSVTVIDTDVPGGTGAGLMAMVEVAALMIGDISQCYCTTGYDDPRHVHPGLFMRRGCVKSLFRPGSSTVVLLFQKGRIQFAEDIIRNLHHPGVESRFSRGLGRPLVETDVKVRSLIGRAWSDD